MDHGQGRVGRKMTYFLRLSFLLGSEGRGAGTSLRAPRWTPGAWSEEHINHAALPQAAEQREGRKEMRARPGRTQSPATCAPEGPWPHPRAAPGRGTERAGAGGRSLHLPPPWDPAGANERVGERAPWSQQSRQGRGRAGPPTSGPSAPKPRAHTRPPRPGLGAGSRTLAPTGQEVAWQHWGRLHDWFPQPTGRAREAAAGTHLPTSPSRSCGATLRPGLHRPPQPTPRRWWRRQRRRRRPDGRGGTAA